MKNRTALITGAARGIGQAIATRLREDGARVLTPARAELDLTSNASIDNYLSAVAEPIDILVNNAGVNRLAAYDEINDEDLQEMLQINLTAQLRLAKELAMRMSVRGYGRIVNVSSIWSVVTKPKRMTYSITKAAINSMTRSLAVELAKTNVLVNAVAPGFVNTELTKQNNSETDIAAICKQIPAARLAEPNEIAEVVGFLCSSRNSYLTGQTLIVDGGYTCL